MAGINLIGIPLFVLLIASLLGILVGFIGKNKKIQRISFIVLAAVIAVYLILALIF